MGPIDFHRCQDQKHLLLARTLDRHRIQIPFEHRSGCGSVPANSDPAFLSVADRMPAKKVFFKVNLLIAVLLEVTFTSVFTDKNQKEVTKY
jgi:hypothetical protein